MEYSCLICDEELLPTKQSTDSIAKNAVSCCTKCGYTFHTTCSQLRDVCPHCKMKTSKNTTANVNFSVGSFEEAFWISISKKDAPLTLKDKLEELDKNVNTYDYFAGEVISFASDESAAMGRRDFADEEYSYDKERMRSARYMTQELESILSLTDLCMEQASYLEGNSVHSTEQNNKTEGDANPDGNSSENSNLQKEETEEKSFTNTLNRDIACPLCQARLFDIRNLIMPVPMDYTLQTFAKGKIACHIQCGYVFHDSCLNEKSAGNQKCPHCKQPVSKNNKVKLNFRLTAIKDFNKPIPETLQGKIGLIKKYLKHLNDLHLELGQKPPKNKAARKKYDKEREEIYKRRVQKYQGLKKVFDASQEQVKALEREPEGSDSQDKSNGAEGEEASKPSCSEAKEPKSKSDAATSENKPAPSSSRKKEAGQKNKKKAAKSTKATPSVSPLKRSARLQKQEESASAKSESAESKKRRSK